MIIEKLSFFLMIIEKEYLCFSYVFPFLFFCFIYLFIFREKLMDGHYFMKYFLITF